MNLGNPDTRRLLKALGQEIAREREWREWTQPELAAATEILAADSGGKPVSKRQVGEIERGDRGQLREAWLVAAALGVSLAKLVKLAEDRVIGDQGTRETSARDAS